MYQEFTVDLADNPYPICFSKHESGRLLERLSGLLGEYSSVFAFVDPAVEAQTRNLIWDNLEMVPDVSIYGFGQQGEGLKQLSELEKIYDWLAEMGADRKSLLIAVGGGVVGDLVGFAAASYLRGVDCIQMPTTLLSMVDSSVGGKTGINLKAGKNLVGAFHQPRAVFVNVDYLSSLSAREFSAGMAEVIKYGMLGDVELFEKLESVERLSATDEALLSVIQKCCEIKAAVVIGDEKEKVTKGGRAMLNLGHTFAHAIENISGYGSYLHGEAVSIGLVLAARLSYEMGNVPSEAVSRVTRLLERYDLPVHLRDPLEIKALLASMKKDKKSLSGQLRFVAMEQIGSATNADDVSIGLVQQLWRTVGAQ